MMLATSDNVFDGIDVGDCESVQLVIVVIAGSTMGATVEELKREVGKLKGHILSQVGKRTLLVILSYVSGRGADEGEKGYGK